jgi:dolichol-phosphate mannosyltransferase
MGSLVVLPTYNERGNLGPIVQAIHKALPDAEVLVVDDASPDGTGELAASLAKGDERLRVLRRSAKLGLGTAYRDAFRLALAGPYAHVIQMDADFSHDPADLPRLAEAVQRGADVAVGSRWVAGGGTRNWGVGRRLLSRGGSFYARTVLGVPVHDLTSGFKCWRRETLASVGLEEVRSEGYGFQIEMTYRAIRRGFRVVEVPIVFVDRRVGQSKMSSAIVREALLGVWRMRARG